MVECAAHAPIRPELIREQPARLVLEARFAPAAAALEPGQSLLVIYHLHRAEPWREELMPELFRRRIACRPNAIGVTLVRVLAWEAAPQAVTITVVGLDALDGSPILDIKPYQPVWDAPDKITEQNE